MRKRLLIVMLSIACILALGVLSACGGTSGSPSGSPSPSTGTPTPSVPPHTHSYVLEITGSSHLAAPATCTEPATYYKSCECGENGTDTFTSGEPQHNFNKEIAEEEFVKVEATTCGGISVYYKSCECGAKGTETFSLPPAGHVFDQEDASRAQYLVTPATCTEAAVYYKSCVCGAYGTDTFTSGDPLDHDYSAKITSKEALVSEATVGVEAVYNYSCALCGVISDDATFTVTVEDASVYTYHALNMSLFTTDELSYGFTWVTDVKPVTPVVQIKKGASDEITNYPVSYTEEIAYPSTKKEDAFLTYSNKGVVPFEKGEVYSYRVYDLGTGTGTDWTEFTTANPDTDTFEFSYVTDNQDHGSHAVAFKVFDNANLGDFMLHGGDIMENSISQEKWRGLFEHSVFSKTPIMLNAGNHDTTESSYPGVTHMHFHYNMPEQNDTKDYGVYYSFEYGNAKFIVINTNLVISGAIPEKQYNWIVSELQSNTKDWLFVTMHVPMYSSRQSNKSPTYGAQMAYRTQLAPIFAEYGVDVVFQGHDHAISKTYPITGQDAPVTTDEVRTENGVEYTVDPSGVIYYCGGPAGSQDYGPDDTVLSSPENVGKFDWSCYGYEASWTEIKMEGNKLTVVSKSYETTDYNGNGTSGEVVVNKSWGIIKGE